MATIKFKHGLLVTLEGIDGSGKTTQFRLLERFLRRQGYPVRATREPGGTPLGEQVRGILLASRNRDLSPLAELALMYAARAQHLQQVVMPALAQGKLVLSDRFNDASRAYQGYGRRLGLRTVEEFDRVICGRRQSDLTLVLDIDPAVALARARARDTASQHTRFEDAGLEFHRRVRAGYLALAKREPRRVKVIRADRPVSDVQDELRATVLAFLGRFTVASG
jgi:dTMP kinase